MNAVALRERPDVYSIEAIGVHRYDKDKVPDTIKQIAGIIWVTSPQVFVDISKDHEVIPNVTYKNLTAGDYGGVYMDDGYWLVCQFDLMQKLAFEWDGNDPIMSIVISSIKDEHARYKELQEKLLFEQDRASKLQDKLNSVTKKLEILSSNKEKFKDVGINIIYVSYLIGLWVITYHLI